MNIRQFFEKNEIGSTQKDIARVYIFDKKISELGIIDANYLYQKYGVVFTHKNGKIKLLARKCEKYDIQD